MASDTVPVLEVRDLVVEFDSSASGGGKQRNRIRAVGGVSLEVRSGHAHGVVGESGCGKSTLVRTIVGLEKPSSGSVLFDGVDVTTLSRRERHETRRQIQLVAQDPSAFLNPRFTVRELVTEPWIVHPGVVRRADREREMKELLARVGVPPNLADRYPRELSGGQRQRICIARALALRPRLLICDEPVSALDVSIQAQILNLLKDLQQALGLACLFISHDLAVVRQQCDQVSVMYLGRLVETGTRDDLYMQPSHPYSQALLSAAPMMEPWKVRDRKEIVLNGEVPSPINVPSGCAFRTRCWMARDRCEQERPELFDHGQGHLTACHFAAADPTVLPPPIDVGGVLAAPTDSLEIIERS